MNRTLKKVLLVLWLTIAIILIGFLVYAIKSDKGIGNMFVFTKINLSDTKVQKEENISLDNYENINISSSSVDIIINSTDEAELKIIEKSNKELDEDDKFTVSENGNTIEINKKQKNKGLQFGIISERIELYIPKKYQKNLQIHSSSGDIEFVSELKLQNLSCDKSSGEFISSEKITAEKVSFKTHSGDVVIKDLDTKYYEVSSSSGEVNIEALNGSGNIEASSGDINIIYKDIEEYTNIKVSSGEINIIVPKELSFEFKGLCNSGEISSNLELDYKGEDKDDATAKVGQGSYKKISARTSSGDINIIQD